MAPAQWTRYFMRRGAAGGAHTAPLTILPEQLPAECSPRRQPARVYFILLLFSYLARGSTAPRTVPLGSQLLASRSGAVRLGVVELLHNQVST